MKSACIPTLINSERGETQCGYRVEHGRLITTSLLQPSHARYSQSLLLCTALVSHSHISLFPDSQEYKEKDQWTANGLIQRFSNLTDHSKRCATHASIHPFTPALIQWTHGATCLPEWFIHSGNTPTPTDQSLGPLWGSGSCQETLRHVNDKCTTSVRQLCLWVRVYYFRTL